MTPRLPPVLSCSDLPEAELHAAKLDGEVFAVGECFSPVDEVIGPAHRARSLAAVLPARMIAEQHTAAWVFGATDVPPPRPELCTDIDARARPASLAVLAVREVVIESSEFCWMGGMRVTTPLRTALDLARFSARFGPGERKAIAMLARLGRFGLADCIEAIESRRNLPLKHRALPRLQAAFSASAPREGNQPAETR